jgi:hypothetical protein
VGVPWKLLFRYLAARLRHRDPAARRYLHDGLSIEERAARLAGHWAPHQERSRAAQSRWLGDPAAGGIDLAVLGAGRLLDFAAGPCASRFRRWLLIDADPSCATHWRAFDNVEVEARIGDLTGCMDRWSRELTGCRGDWNETLQFVREIAAIPFAPVMAFAADAVLSLNVLSQLPIGWQDVVEEHLERRFGSPRTKENEEEWLAAVEPGGRRIVEQHLEALAASSARSILLIADVEYAEYRGGANSVRWRDGTWGADAGLSVHVSPALYGVAPEIAGYTVRWRDSWLWDISPIGAENHAYGSVHRVEALAFDRS